MPSLTGRRPPVLLELDLTQPLLEPSPEDPVGKLQARGKPRLRAVLRTLHEAGEDPRVAGLIAKLGGSAMPLAVAQELREGVRRFAASGKPTIAWAETFGEFSTGTVPYLLATGFNEIWLQPSGELGLVGVMAEVTFLRGALDKAGVEPQIGQRYEYKNAADRILRKELSEPHREALGRIAESSWEGVIASIAEARGLTEDEVRALADRGPLLAQAALEARLIDRCGYRDEAYQEIRRRVGGEVRLLFGTRWAPSTSPARKIAKAVTTRNQSVVALVDGFGTIVVGRSRRTLTGGRQMGSDTVAAAIRAARKDEKVRALVFRVDSPGGSYVASDTIRREVALTRESGKPVVISMGSVAGSGGYFVSIPADVIVAQPATITGSIGVLGGKAVTTGLLDHVGLSTGAVAQGAHARIFSPRVRFTDEEFDQMSAWLDTVYADFIGKVAEGRKMSTDAVHEIAKGRIWSGADALQRGLVDSLGGLREATSIARERAGLPASAPLRPAVHVKALAKLRSPRSSDDPRAVSMHAAAWGDFSSLAAALGLPAGGPLMMPSVRLT